MTYLKSQSKLMIYIIKFLPNFNCKFFIALLYTILKMLNVVIFKMSFRIIRNKIILVLF